MVQIKIQGLTVSPDLFSFTCNPGNDSRISPLLGPRPRLWAFCLWRGCREFLVDINGWNVRRKKRLRIGKSTSPGCVLVIWGDFFLILSIAMAFPYHHQTITSSPSPKIKVTMKKSPCWEGNFTTESPSLSLDLCVSNPIFVGGKSRWKKKRWVRWMPQKERDHFVRRCGVSVWGDWWLTDPRS